MRKLKNPGKEKLHGCHFSCDSCLQEKEVMIVMNDWDEKEWEFDYDHVYICEECLKKALELIGKEV